MLHRYTLLRTLGWGRHADKVLTFSFTAIFSLSTEVFICMVVIFATSNQQLVVQCFDEWCCDRQSAPLVVVVFFERHILKLTGGVTLNLKFSKNIEFRTILNCPNNDVYITVVYVIGSAEQSVSCSTQCRRCTCRRRRMARRRLGHRMMDFGHQCGRGRSRMLNRVLAWLRLGSPRSRTGVRPLLLASQNRIQTHLEHKTPPHYLARHTAHSHTSCAFFNCIFVMFF